MEEDNKKLYAYSSRSVDLLAKDMDSWWKKTFVYVTKKKVASWKGFFIIMFVAGLLCALILSVSYNIYAQPR